MQNSFVYDTGIRPDYTRGGIKEKSSDRPPVESPISKSALILETFQHTIKTLPASSPPINHFPFTCVDWRMASRMKEVLGMHQDRETSWRGNPYCVLGKNVFEWIKDFENLIGEKQILEEFIVGSAAAYIAGQPLLREALEVFLQMIPDQHPQKEKLRIKIAGKIAQKTFPFADVDLRIKVAPHYDLAQLKEKIDSIKGCRSELYKNKTLIVYVGENEENALDIVIYTELDNESALNLDDFKVNIKRSDLEKKQIVFESTDPWKWWEGHTLGVLENKSTDALRIMHRVLWQISKGKVSRLPIEKTIFPDWLKAINFKLRQNKEIIQQQFVKQQQNHDRHIPLVDCLLRLRMQQLMRDHSPASNKELKEVAKIKMDKTVPPFIQALFHAMNEKGSDISVIHSLIECVALLALYEAWQKPFEVKFVKHEETWTMRLRFRGKFKRDLLVRFDIPASLNVLKKATVEQWRKMWVIVHSLWFDGFSQRTVEPAYKKTLGDKQIFPMPLAARNIEEIKKIFLKNTGFAQKEVVFAQLAPLAQLEIDWSQEAKYLLEIGKIVFNHYHHDAVMRSKLCWKIVYKCIHIGGFFEAAEMVNLLRESREDPVEGYISLFAHAVLKGGNSYLYEACSPFPPVKDAKWLQLAQSKNKPKDVVAIMNEADVSAELFLEMVRLLKMKDYSMSESILCKILAFDKKRACDWIRKKDDRSFVSQEYTQLVSEILVENKGAFDPVWMKDFLLSKRFRGAQASCISLCKYLLSKPLDVADKAGLLHAFEIKESSLWQQVANEYISQGDSWPEMYNKEAQIDFQTLVLWHQLMECADDEALANGILDKIPTPKDGGRDIIRGLVLVRLLKNWKNKKVAISLLKKLDLSKKPLPWDTILHNSQKGEDILKKLYHVSLPLYSALFRAIKPKEPFYASYWVNMMLAAFPIEKNAELLAAINSSLMIDCLQIQPMISLAIFKRVADSQDGIQFILDSLKEADQEIFCMMVRAAVAFDDGGAAGAAVFLKYFGTIANLKKTKELIHDLSLLAIKLLMNPQGDLEAAGLIWKAIRNHVKPERLPPQKNLLRLIQLNYSDWVTELLNNAQKKELESLDPEVYCCLLRQVQDLEKRCLILEGCSVLSPSIQKQWEITAQSDGMHPFAALKLLKSARQLQVSDTKAQQCALHLFSKNSEAIIDIEAPVLKYLVEMIYRLDMVKALELWEALQMSRRVEKSDLWETALHILSRNPHAPSFRLLSWVTHHSYGQSSEQFLDLVTGITRYPLEERTLSLLFATLKREALKQNEKAIKLYWDLDFDENIAKTDLEQLGANAEQCKKTLHRLIKKSQQGGFKTSLFASLMHVWIKHRSLVEVEDIHAIYGIISNYISEVDEKEKIFWLGQCVDPLTSDVNHFGNKNEDLLNQSVGIQSLIGQLINHEEVLGSDQKMILLHYLSKNKLHVKQQWKLIAALGSSTDIIAYSCSIDAMEKMEDVNPCPARILFQCHRFPNFMIKIDGIVRRITDGPRVNYLRGILLSVTLINNGGTEFASKFLSYLPHVYKYLVKHQKNEIPEWDMIKSMMINHPEIEESDDKEFKDFPVDRLIFGFAMKNFINAYPSFLDKNVFKMLLDTIEKIANNFCFRLYLIKRIGKNAEQNFDSEQAGHYIDFILDKLAKKTTSEKINTQEALKLSCHLLFQATELILKHFPCHNKLILFSQSIIHGFIKARPLENEHIKLISYSAYMMLKGNIDVFSNVQFSDEAGPVTYAIKKLCEYPHPKNLKKAQQLLYQGITSAIFLDSTLLIELHESFIKSSLKACAAGNSSDLIQQLFLHLFPPQSEENVFEMSKENLNVFYKQMTKIRGAKEPSPIQCEDAYQAYKTLRLDLIYNSIIMILDSKKYPLDLLIGHLDISILAFLTDEYKNNPEHAAKLMRLLVNACEESYRQDLTQSTKIHFEVACMLCSRPFFPLEPWRAFYCQASLENMFNDLQEARKDHAKFESCNGDRKALLKLSREDDKAPFEMTSEAINVSLMKRYQWLEVSFRVFYDAPFDEDTKKWMHQIEGDILCGLLCSQLSPLEGIANHILYMVQRLLLKNEKLSKTNPDFANQWLQKFIGDLQKQVKIQEHKWFLGTIEELIEEIMTPELLPCLPYLEEFSRELSSIHSQRECIDAYGRLMALRCEDDAIIKKAVRNASQLITKVKINSEKSDNKRFVIFNFVPNENYATNFELIYYIGIQKILKDFKEDNDHEKFIRELQQFREFTDKPLLEIELISLPKFRDKISKLFYGYIDLFCNQALCKNVLEYIQFVHRLDAPIEPNEYNLVGEFNLMYFIFALLMGPDTEGTLSNKYITELESSTRALLNYIHPSVDLDNHFVFFVTVGVAITSITPIDDNSDSIFTKDSIPMFQGAECRKLYIKILTGFLKEIDRFKKVRPELNEWFDQWKIKIEGTILYFSEELRRIDSLSKKASKNLAKFSHFI